MELVRRLLGAAALLTGAALLVTSCTEGTANKPGNTKDTGTKNQPAANASGGTLDVVKKRGKLICGVNGTIAGMSTVSSSGEFAGFDIDLCKAVAAAVLGDPTKVEYKKLTTDNRFTALKAREIDVLIRNTTSTASRDGKEGVTFLHTTFYDGGGMMVKASSKYKKLADMGGATICILSGTTNEQNLTNAFKARNITFKEPLSFNDNTPLQETFRKGRCDGWFSDHSQLSASRATWPASAGGPESILIFDEIYSKEPLTPAVRDGDSQWAQVVNWSIMSTIAAEELGITQSNVDDMKANSKAADVQQLLGTADGKPFDPALGLDPDFAIKVLKAVGNYGEIFDRNLGPSTPLKMERGLNNLWNKGGIQYVPPYR